MLARRHVSTNDSRWTRHHCTISLVRRRWILQCCSICVYVVRCITDAGNCMRSDEAQNPKERRRGGHGGRILYRVGLEGSFRLRLATCSTDASRSVASSNRRKPNIDRIGFDAELPQATESRVIATPTLTIRSPVRVDEGLQEFSLTQSVLPGVGHRTCRESARVWQTVVAQRFRSLAVRTRRRRQGFVPSVA